MSQQYSLRWNNHQPNFISMFTNLLNTQTLVDVTLAAEGKHLLAHKVVLSACSSYFQALFVDNPSRHPIVILKDVTFADLRTMVDFMYYGEVNVTEEQLPQVLETAKHLKIKGLTEMPDSASLTRSQGNDLPNAPNAPDTSPPNSPAHKRRRRRKSSTGSTCLNMIGDDRGDIGNQTGDLPRNDTITFSSVPRRRDFHDERTIDQAQQTNEHHNLNMEPLSMDTNTHVAQESLKQRRVKFRRQSRVQTDSLDLRKQSSEPVPSTSQLTLLKHQPYPQCRKVRPVKTQEQKVSTLLIRKYTLPDKASSTSSESGESPATQRASHTPAVLSGPPLSCNYCWNTVDECGRILRRKTQYHCPECKTNLCIVPCFHEYHEGSIRES